MRGPCESVLLSRGEFDAYPLVVAERDFRNRAYNRPACLQIQVLFDAWHAKGTSMKNFLMNSACNGRRPKGSGQRKRYARPRLMKKMMEERQVARFLVAPRGFGKTSLAVEYADSIFGFHNVFWVDCQSPCFLRDLDAGIIASALSELAVQRSLAVFEDVPYLDDERADAFSAAIDALLSGGWEVVVSLLPPYDSFADRQPDRLLIEAGDFLVDDSEIAAVGTPSSHAKVRMQERVSVLVWGDEAEREEFLGSLDAAEMPPEMRLATFVMLVLEEGVFEDVTALVRGVRRDALRFLARHYPHLGVDLVSEGFRTIRVPVERISRAYSASVESSVERAGAVGRDALAVRLADLLVEKGAHRRACEVVRALCARKRRLAWIERSHARYMAAAQIAPLQDLFESLGKHPTGLSPRALVDAAMRSKLLGDGLGAARLASRAMAHPDAPLSIRCEAALICEECGDGDKERRALRILERVSALRDALRADDPQELGALRGAAASRLAMRRSPREALAALAPYESEVSESQAAMAHLASLLACANGRPARSEWISWPRGERDEAANVALRCLGATSLSQSIPGALESLIADEVASMVGDALGDEGWRRIADDRAALLSLQREEWTARLRREAAAVVSRSTSHRDGHDVAQRVPEMRVRLFGGMEVRIGGRMVDPGSFKKQKAKTLLAVLVLHRGREVPRRELVEVMWPDSRWERAVSNFYSIWSLLRKALSDEEGRCPYLVRHQESCMVDTRFVRSDVEEFEELYRRLMFDSPDPRAWMGVFERLSSGFFCDLLPSESNNTYIVAMRERFKRRTVDACVTAAARLCDIREPQTALWFASAALEMDPGREDVYYALMRAQLMSGRRTSAMETYFACLKFMGDELGMGPSERMVRLYDELLVCAEDG